MAASKSSSQRGGAEGPAEPTGAGSDDWGAPETTEQFDGERNLVPEPLEENRYRNPYSHRLYGLLPCSLSGL